MAFVYSAPDKMIISVVRTTTGRKAVPRLWREAQRRLSDRIK